MKRPRITTSRVRSDDIPHYVVGDFASRRALLAMPYYYAFDCLWLDGEDVRTLRLIDRKRILKRIVPRKNSRLLFVRHQRRRGADLFRLVCESDLEGIVAKRKESAYGEDWIKVKNPDYSQAKGRREHFEMIRRKP